MVLRFGMFWRLALLPALIAASPNAGHREQELMNTIERMVTLPPRAKPLLAYARSYAYLTPTTVRAVYLALPDPAPVRSCTRYKSGVGSRPCTPQEVETLQRQQREAIADRPRRGERRWYSDPKDMPYFFDGGCTQVTFDYDIAAQQFTSVLCNGYA